LLPFVQHRHAPRQHRRPQMATAVIAIEAMALWQLTQLMGGPGHAVPQPAGSLDAKRLLQRLHIAGPPQDRLPTVAPGGGPGDATGLKQNHAPPRLGKTQSSMQPAEA